MESNIITWLEKQGYPLEMYTSLKFKENKFRVSQSVYYYDHELNKNREIDIIAYRGKFVDNKFAFIEYVIECKSSEKPWLLFCSKRETSYDSAIEFGEYDFTDDSFPLLSHLVAKDLLAKLCPFYFDFKHIGYGLTQAFTTGNDNAFKATQTLIKCCDSKRTESEKSSIEEVKIFIPILLVDSPVFEVSLSDEYKLELKQIEVGFLSTNNHSILIMNKSNLDSFCKCAHASSEWLIDYCESNLSYIIKEYDGAI